MKHDEKIGKAKKITLIGSLIDLSLGLVKIFIGKLYFSQALITDGVHSLSDLLSDAFVFFMAKVSFSKADDDHPYGHGKFENLATTVIGSVLIIVAIKMAYESYELMFLTEPRSRPGLMTIFVAVLSILSKEWIFRKTLKVGQELKSSMLIANAWHSRTDAISSLLILIGLVCSIFINEKIDLLIAFAVSIYIGKIGYNLIRDALIDLVDTSLSTEVQDEIKKIVMSVDGVKGFHNLRSRKIGSNAFVDINIEVAPKISVSEGHQIATWVSSRIRSEVEEIADITVHTDVEDDRGHEEDYVEHDSVLLPLRSKVLTSIVKEIGKDHFDKHVKSVVIHYVEGCIVLDVFLNIDSTNFRFDLNKVETVRIEKIHFYITV